MLQTQENIVKIEGVLSEIDLEEGTVVKNGVTQKTIGGTIKVRVNQKINNEDVELEVPVYLYSAQYTNAGKPNPAYDSIKSINDEYVSIAAAGYEQADRIRITKGNVAMNEYYSKTGALISYPRIRASFVSRISKADCKPEASFSVVFMVGSKGFVTDADGVETNKYKVVGMIPQYGGHVDVIPFYTTNAGVIDAISNYWNDGDTVKASGRLNFSSKTETVLVDVDFGEPQEQTKTVSVSELIITGGSSTPLDGDFALNVSDVQAALAERKEKLAELKDKAANRGTAGKAPVQSKTTKFSDLGF